MDFPSLNWPLALHLSAEDTARVKKVVINSIVWVAAAIAIRILLPVPGKALCVIASSTLLSGLTFVHLTPGSYLHVIPEEYPKLPLFTVLFAIVVQPYSTVLGIAVSMAAGIVRGFYLTRIPQEVEHEMTDV